MVKVEEALIPGTHNLCFTLTDSLGKQEKVLVPLVITQENKRGKLSHARSDPEAEVAKVKARMEEQEAVALAHLKDRTQNAGGDCGCSDSGTASKDISQASAAEGNDSSASISTAS